MVLVESILEAEQINKELQGEQLLHTTDRQGVLPTEILVYIFTLCSSHTHGLLGSSPHNRPFAWTLSAVCRRWREVSLSLPRLWCRFSINLHGSTCGNVVEMVNTHLVRSGQSPLELKLYSGFPRTNLRTSIRDTMTNPLIEHSQHSSGDIHLVRAVHSSFPALRKLELYYTTRLHVIGYPFRTATNLTTLHLTGRIDLPDLIWALSSSPNLECLSMKLMPYRNETAISPNKVQLSRLRILRFGGYICYEAFVQMLITPNLEVLVIEWLHLFVEGCLSVLEKTPKLTHFWISAAPFISWLHALNLRHHPNICHGLRQVGVFTSDSIVPSERAAALASLKDMIQVRLGTLESVVLDSWAHRALLGWISELRPAGLDVCVADMSSIRDQYNF